MSAVYAWLRRHPKLVDGGLAAIIAFLGVGMAVPAGYYAMILVGLALAIPLVLRRTHPVGAFAFVIAVGVLQVVTGLHPGPADLSVVILLYTLAAYKPRRVSVTGLAVCLAGSAAAVGRWGTPGKLTWLEWMLTGSIAFAGPSLIAWVLGDSVRYRRAYYANLEERAARLEAERDAQAQIAAAAERARIARELHDVVAHNVSVMVVQADGASYTLDTDPARAREALAAIAGTGRQALAEMRRLLGVLRRDDDGTDPGRAPLPGIGQIGELLEQTRAAGLPVALTVEGVPQPLPDGAALAAYRIVQESLTNTRKHAGPLATAQVILRYLEDALVLRITDDGPGPAATPDGGGHGLTGMRERVAVYGGWVAGAPGVGGGRGAPAGRPCPPARAGGPGRGPAVLTQAAQPSGAWMDEPGAGAA